MINDSGTIPIKVGLIPVGVANDPNTNTIYVANHDSMTISIINGKTNKLVSGVRFRTDPPNSGIIVCDGKEVSDEKFIKYDIDENILCEAKADTFPPLRYSSWSAIPPVVFDSWSNSMASNTDDLAKTSFKITQFGNITAGFREVIPSTYMGSLFEPGNTITILSIAIPSIFGAIYALRKRRNTTSLMKAIDKAYYRRIKQRREFITSSPVKVKDYESCKTRKDK